MLIDFPINKNAGCHSITFGLESGNDYILQNIAKDFTAQDIKRAFSICHKYKIKPIDHFIIDLPGETYASVENTIKLAKDINCDFASFNLIMQLPGTELFGNASATSGNITIFSDVDATSMVYNSELSEKNY